MKLDFGLMFGCVGISMCVCADEVDFDEIGGAGNGLVRREIG